MEDEDFKTFFNQTCRRVSDITQEKYPGVLGRPEEDLWPWVRQNREDQYGKLKCLEEEMEAFWKNRVFPEFKKLCLDWGRGYLDLFKAFHQHLQEA